jgi:hypothetical protein
MCGSLLAHGRLIARLAKVLPVLGKFSITNPFAIILAMHHNLIVAQLSIGYASRPNPLVPMMIESLF